MQKFIVSGQIEVSVPIELPTKKSQLKKIADKIGYGGEITIEAITKAIVLQAVQVGLDNMEYRQSEANSAEAYSLDVEEC